MFSGCSWTAIKWTIFADKKKTTTTTFCRLIRSKSNEFGCRFVYSETAWQTCSLPWQMDSFVIHTAIDQYNECKEWDFYFRSRRTVLWLTVWWRAWAAAFIQEYRRRIDLNDFSFAVARRVVYPLESSDIYRCFALMPVKLPYMAGKHNKSAHK